MVLFDQSSTCSLLDLQQHMTHVGVIHRSAVWKATKAPALANFNTFCDMQDVVTREGKLLILYKRPGQRVIIDAKGRLIVRPTHLEASVQRDTAGTGLVSPQE